MKISDFLKRVGKSALKEVPMGNVILDVVDMVTDNDVDKEHLTGEDMLKFIEELPPETRVRILETKLNSDVARYEAWADLRAKMEEDTPSSRMRSWLAVAITVVLLILSLGFGYIAYLNYEATGTLPTPETLMIVFGLPGIALLSHFGIQTDQLMNLLISMITKHQLKKKA